MSLKVKKINIKDALKINEILDKNEKAQKENIPIYQKLYPPLKDLFIYDENNEINNNLLKIKAQISKRLKISNFLADEQRDEMDEEFLNDLIKVPCPLAKSKIINVISKFIQKSKLIEKLEIDYQSDKKIATHSLSEICAEKLNYKEFHPGEIVFKIGEPGDKFYFILNGNVSILKLKELLDIEMTYIQYINYCMFLYNSKEEYILNEVIKANHSVLNLTSIEDIKSIYKIIFMKTLTDNINKNILNNNHLKLFFQQNGQKFQDYDIEKEELDILEQQKLKGLQGAGKEWENYITKRCKLTISEQMFFQPYEKIFTEHKPKKIRCFCYHSFLYLGPGLYFGDTAIDFENNKRNATIRAEDFTILAYLNREDYLNIISPKHKMEKLKEIEFIYEKFFFSDINSHLFEKNYFHLFSPREYYRGSILFSNGTIPRSLILLKSGRISLELKGSVIDIHNLIKFIYNNIFTNPMFSKLSQGTKNRYLPNNKLSIIKSYINDPILTRLKTHNNRFIEEMNIVKTYQIKILTKYETLGLEEIFLRLPYIMKSIVVSEKIVCYELALEHMDKMLNIGRDIIYSYIKFSINKIVSLIERLQNIKQNYIHMSLAKYENDILKYRGLKNKIENDLMEKKEENKKEKSRNKKFITTTDLSSKDKENTFNNFNSNDKEIINSTIISQKTSSSPIKLFMTNISPKSKSMFEKMKLAYNKLQKKQFKFRNNRLISPVNNSINLKKTFNKTKNTYNNKNTNKKIFNQTEINKALSYDSNIKDESQTSFLNNINNIKTPKYSLNNKLLEKNDEKNQTDKISLEYDKQKYIFNKKVEIKKNHPFNLSYVPLDLICKNENIENENIKNIPFVSNINKLLKTNKRTIDFYSNIGIVNNNDNISKANRTDRIIDIKKRLKLINKKYQLKNNSKENNVEKVINIINKKNLITGIIKDFYKDIRLNGYNSFIHNKEINTVFMRKYNKKYDSAEKVFNNIKFNLLKRSDSLPIIN